MTGARFSEVKPVAINEYFLICEDYPEYFSKITKIHTTPMQFPEEDIIKEHIEWTATIFEGWLNLPKCTFDIAAYQVGDDPLIVFDPYESDYHKTS